MKGEVKMKNGIKRSMLTILSLVMILGCFGDVSKAQGAQKSSTYTGTYMGFSTSLDPYYTGTSVWNQNSSISRYCYTSAYTYNSSGTQIDYNNTYGPKTTGAVDSYYYSSSGACAKVKGYGSIRSTSSSTSTLLEKHTTTLSN